MSEPLAESAAEALEQLRGRLPKDARRGLRDALATLERLVENEEARARARALPEAQRAAERALVALRRVELLSVNPRLSARELCRRIAAAHGLPKRRVRGYLEALRGVSDVDLAHASSGIVPVHGPADSDE